MKVSEIADFFTKFSFYTLFFLVPLFWLPLNYELFEFNKMIIVYVLTVVILTSWLVKAIDQKRLVIKRTPLDIPILLFLAANFLATVFSIDPHTSIFGYYGRFHGGLLSTIAYSLLYFALVSNSTPKQVLYYLYTLLGSSILVSFYGILQHPNPLFQETVNGQTIFHGIDYKYWAVNVEERVFSTLGQPNWLAAFLAMTIFPLTALLFIYQRVWQRILLLIGVTLTYLAFTFAYSRGGTLGLLVGVITFSTLLLSRGRDGLKVLKVHVASIAKTSLSHSKNLLEKSRKLLKRINWLVSHLKTSQLKNLPLEKQSFRKVWDKPLFWLLSLSVILLIVNFYFGNALERRGIIPSITPQNQTSSQEQLVRQTQLETHGKDTAKIRMIVWSGALEIFKHNPIFGTGVETFGYSYYLHRPAEHNLTPEWDYLYNKAHNEYLNYLATTGIVGFVTYLILIGAFEFVAIRSIIKTNFPAVRLLLTSLLAGYNSYLVQNIFGFSVVPIALLFSLYPAIFIILANQENKVYVLDLSKKLPFLNQNLANQTSKVFILVLGLLTVFSVLSMWLADFYYNKALSGTSYDKSIGYLKIAANLNVFEPIYKAELALNYAGLATTTKDETIAKEARGKAREIINQTVNSHKNSFNLWQTKRVVDFTLAKIDKASNLELSATVEKLNELAPTDASTQYEIALVYTYLEEKGKAQEQLEKVVKLKPDYQEAVILLAETYYNNGKTDSAINLLQDWIKTHPQDLEAINLLKSMLTS